MIGDAAFPRSFSCWERALRVARVRASATGKRQAVKRSTPAPAWPWGTWIVAEVDL